MLDGSLLPEDDVRLSVIVKATGEGVWSSVLSSLRTKSCRAATATREPYLVVRLVKRERVEGIGIEPDHVLLEQDRALTGRAVSDAARVAVATDARHGLRVDFVPDGLQKHANRRHQADNRNERKGN